MHSVWDCGVVIVQHLYEGTCGSHGGHFVVVVVVVVVVASVKMNPLLCVYNLHRQIFTPISVKSELEGGWEGGDTYLMYALCV